VHRNNPAQVPKATEHAFVGVAGARSVDLAELRPRFRGELIRLQTGFTDLAKHIGAKAYDKAAEVDISLREGLASWYGTHPALVESIEKLSVISLATFVLTAVGSRLS